MNSRIKKVRNEIGLSQEEFGKRLGITGSGLSNIESGKRNVTEQMILAICREFKVDEEWLRTGCGGDNVVYRDCDDTNISAVVSDFHLDDLSKSILTAYVNMEDSKRSAFNAFVREMADNIVEQSKEKARIGINEIIANSRASDTVKSDLTGKAASIFIDAFPYIGFGNMDKSEMSEEISDEQRLSGLHEMLNDQFSKEKKQESKASSVKESDAG